jgi:hypothetical protein
MQWRVWGVLLLTTSGSAIGGQRLVSFGWRAQWLQWIGGMGVGYALIFQQPVADYIPFSASASLFGRSCPGS